MVTCMLSGMQLCQDMRKSPFYLPFLLCSSSSTTLLKCSKSLNMLPNPGVVDFLVLGQNVNIFWLLAAHFSFEGVQRFFSPPHCAILHAEHGFLDLFGITGFGVWDCDGFDLYVNATWLVEGCSSTDGAWGCEGTTNSIGALDEPDGITCAEVGRGCSCRKVEADAIAPVDDEGTCSVSST